MNMDRKPTTSVTMMLIGLAMLATAGLIFLAAVGREQPAALSDIALYIVAAVAGGGATAVAGAGIAGHIENRRRQDWTQDDNDAVD